MTPKMMLEIALCHAKRGAKFLRDDSGRPRFRIGSKTDLLGAFIPLSIYYETDRIESMTTYDLCDGKILTREQLEIVNRLDHIQACHPEAKWARKIQELLDEY